MPWCPKCRTEYREGFSVCSDCGSSLVADLAPLAPAAKAGRDRTVPSVQLLVSVPDDDEAGIIQAALRSCGIPVLKKYRKAGGYLEVYMGMTAYGIDLYVPAELYAEAKAIIEAELPPEAAAEGEAETKFTSARTASERNRRRIIWLLLFSLVVPALIAALLAALD